MGHGSDTTIWFGLSALADVLFIAGVVITVVGALLWCGKWFLIRNK